MRAGPFIRSMIEGEIKAAAEFQREARETEREYERKSRLLREAAGNCMTRAKKWAEGTDYSFEQAYANVHRNDGE